MTEAIKGKTVQEAEDLFRKFHAMVTGGAASSNEDDLGKLAVFAGVRAFPMRVKCATLGWHTLHQALQDGSEEVTTE
jgi:nitrogen fixation NifU-like protein